MRVHHPLRLLVEPDGAVLPDPATMITPDLGIPPNTSSDAALATATLPRLSASVVTAPGRPGYARDEDISLMEAGNDRTQAVQGIQRGAVRTFLGLLPSGLAALDALVQLIFTLCLIALWIGLPIGLVFVFFDQNAGGVTGLFRRMLSVLQVSWSSSVLLGLVAACLISAAGLRNAAAYTGFAIGGLILTLYMLLVAVDTLKSCVRTLNDTVMTATGLSVTRPLELAGAAGSAALQAGATAVTGGAVVGLTAAAALQATGSGRYAPPAPPPAGPTRRLSSLKLPPRSWPRSL